MISFSILLKVVFKAGAWPVIKKEKMENKVYKNQNIQVPCKLGIDSYALKNIWVGKDKFLFCCYMTASCYAVARTDLKLKSSCLSFFSAGLTGVCHPAWPNFHFKAVRRREESTKCFLLLLFLANPFNITKHLEIINTCIQHS